jgi:hypothetical protein
MSGSDADVAATLAEYRAELAALEAELSALGAGPAARRRRLAAAGAEGWDAGALLEKVGERV